MPFIFWKNSKVRLQTLISQIPKIKNLKFKLTIYFVAMKNLSALISGIVLCPVLFYRPIALLNLKCISIMNMFGKKLTTFF